jgi:4-hydroxy-3-methylbut-2-enyl diphosphate reductase
VEIVVASRAGFCFGVKRAIKRAYDTVGQAKGEVATLGPIIHNPQVVSHLERMGVRPIKNLREFQGEVLVIRSHGIPKSLLDEAKASGVRIVDATCPFVKKAQDDARRLSEEGYTVVIVGDRDHPEVEGILSFAGEAAIVAGDESDLGDLQSVKKIGIIAQTTTTFDRFRNVVNRCLEMAHELIIYNTICDATHYRQKEAEEIARSVDVMLVVGGKNSGNTNRLAELCRQTGTRTFHVETRDEVDPGWFQKTSRVGVTAGASTPDWIIQDVLDFLEGIV